MKNILAKSDGETLQEHTLKCCEIYSQLVDIFPDIDTHINFEKFYRTVLIALFFHDFGKASSEFQKKLLGKRSQWEGYRHEILSTPFTNSISLQPSELNIIKIFIITHHKDLAKILEYRESSFSIPFSERLATLSNSLATLHDFSDQLSVLLKENCMEPISSEFPTSFHYAESDWTEPVLHLNRRMDTLSTPEKMQYILAKGMINAADYLASAGITKIYKPVLDASVLYPYPKLTTVQQSCKNIRGDAIVISPTGSGKTEAALFWASNNQNRTHGSRIFYTLPYTASINAMYIRLSKVLKPHYQDEKDAECDAHTDYISMLHGKASYFLSKLHDDDDVAKHARKVSRLVCSPYKIITPYQAIKHFFSLKGYEMGMLEMYKGVFILDEIHSYDAATIAQILGMCKFLKSQLDAKILLMSATLPSFISQLFITHLNISDDNIITMNKEEQEEYARHECHILQGRIDDAIERIRNDLVAGKRVLVVCNTIATSQDIFGKLKDITQNSILIHSRFIVKDRERIENKIINGESNTDSDPLQLLVGTQAIEVSLDIDYDTCYTEPAPIDALIQRFGRVNRKRKKGICPVFVCSHGSDSDKYIYNSNHLEKTLEELKSLEAQSDTPILHEWKLQDIVDSVYSDGFSEKEEEFNTILNSFDKMMDDIIPFNSVDKSESEFFDKFDSIEVVPIRWKTEYLEDIQHGNHLDVLKWTLTISKRNFKRLESEKRIEKGEKDKVLFIDAKYDDELGLIISDREPDNIIF